MCSSKEHTLLLMWSIIWELAGTVYLLKYNAATVEFGDWTYRIQSHLGNYYYRLPKNACKLGVMVRMHYFFADLLWNRILLLPEFRWTTCKIRMERNESYPQSQRTKKCL